MICASGQGSMVQTEPPSEYLVAVWACPTQWACFLPEEQKCRSIPPLLSPSLQVYIWLMWWRLSGGSVVTSSRSLSASSPRQWGGWAFFSFLDSAINPSYTQKREGMRQNFRNHLVFSWQRRAWLFHLAGRASDPAALLGFRVGGLEKVEVYKVVSGCQLSKCFCSLFSLHLQTSVLLQQSGSVCETCLAVTCADDARWCYRPSFLVLCH